MKRKTTSEIVDSWIADEELPVRAGLKKIKPAFLCLFPEDERLSGKELELENQAYWDFIRWCLSIEDEVLLSIPKPEIKDDFRIPYETDEDGIMSFPFSSADFQRLLPKFNSYHYRLKKIYERVADLAQTYSCLTNESGKRNIEERFNIIINNNFRYRLRKLLKTYNNYSVWFNKHRLIEKIQDLNGKIRKCKDIWDKHAYERG